jgi:hypothetical protein
MARSARQVADRGVIACIADAVKAEREAGKSWLRRTASPCACRCPARSKGEPVRATEQIPEKRGTAHRSVMMHERAIVGKFSRPRRNAGSSGSNRSTPSALVGCVRGTESAPSFGRFEIFCNFFSLVDSIASHLAHSRLRARAAHTSVRGGDVVATRSYQIGLEVERVDIGIVIDVHRLRSARTGHTQRRSRTRSCRDCRVPSSGTTMKAPAPGASRKRQRQPGGCRWPVPAPANS